MAPKTLINSYSYFRNTNTCCSVSLVGSTLWYLSYHQQKTKKVFNIFLSALNMLILSLFASYRKMLGK